MVGYGVGFAIITGVPFRISAEAGGPFGTSLYVGTNMLDIGGFQTGNIGGEASATAGMWTLA